MLLSWMNRRRPFAIPVRPEAGPAARRFRPGIELLEQRRLLTAATTVFLAAPNPSVAGQDVTLTATVAGVPPGAGTPTGSVTFSDGAAALISVPLNSSDQASFTTAALTVGGHALSALYSGDPNFSPSASPVFTEQVNKAGTTLMLQLSANPAASGQAVTLTAAVAAAAPGSGTPTGPVTFYDNGNAIGTGTLNGLGLATLTTAALAPGGHTLSAQYGGDGNFSSSPLASITQQVNLSRTTLARIIQRGMSPPVLTVFPPNGARKFQVRLSAPSFQNGAHFIASGDFTGDGIDDVVVVSNPSRHGTLLEVFNGATGAVLFRIFPYGRSFAGPVQVTVTAPNSSGLAGITTTAQVKGQLVQHTYCPSMTPPTPIVARTIMGPDGSPPVLQVFAPDSVSLKFQVTLTDPSFGSGLRFTPLGDVNGDGVNDVVLVSNPSPHGALVEAIDGVTGAVLFHKFPYGRRYTGLVRVAAGVLNGDCFAHIVTRAVVNGLRVQLIFNARSSHPTKGHKPPNLVFV
jgi:hypothetical protein